MELANEIKNGYKKLFDKLVWGLFVIVFLGLVGIGKYNFDCDAQREVEAKKSMKELCKKQDDNLKEVKHEIKDDIQEIKVDMKELKRDMKDDMKEIKQLIRKSN